MSITEESIREAREKWITALEGTGGRKFRQTRGKLRTRSARGFCCLGVAAEAVGPDYGVRRLLNGGTDYVYVPPNQSLIMAGELRGPLRNALGLTRSMQNFLIALNDDAKLGFDIIAKVIRLLPVYASYSAASNHERRRMMEPFKPAQWVQTIPDNIGHLIQAFA